MIGIYDHTENDIAVVRKTESFWKCRESHRDEQDAVVTNCTTTPNCRRWFPKSCPTSFDDAEATAQERNIC